MELNQIKKYLYKENPEAKLTLIRKGTAYYSAEGINFEVPVSDMGDADYFPEMDSKYLIRYIVIKEHENA